jgi:hypothetical protein
VGEPLDLSAGVADPVAFGVLFIRIHGIAGGEADETWAAGHGGPGTGTPE